VYNAGGSRFSNCSMLEAIRMCEEITGRRMNVTYSDQERSGDHIWYVSDCASSAVIIPSGSMVLPCRISCSRFMPVSAPGFLERVLHALQIGVRKLK
jgi:hypothetical protein